MSIEMKRFRRRCQGMFYREVCKLKKTSAKLFGIMYSLVSCDLTFVSAVYKQTIKKLKNIFLLFPQIYLSLMLFLSVSGLAYCPDTSG